MTNNVDDTKKKTNNEESPAEKLALLKSNALAALALYTIASDYTPDRTIARTLGDAFELVNEIEAALAVGGAR